MKQVIRIIGGRFRGKKITFPSINGLRPTPDRVRETLFNWLMNDIRGARCLDAFSGSGALGFEAFSRGAAEVCLLEKNKTAFANLQTIIKSFNENHLTTINTDACDFMRHTKQSFDIIFLDPPFDSFLLTSCLEDLGKLPILNQGGLVYCESSNEIIFDQLVWELLKQKKAGQVVYGLLKKRS